jgi:16S rRNA (guanine966-N2)-methyltransferase
VKVIAGRWRGRPLRAPRGAPTRPSSARLREALFSAIGKLVEGARVIDLFAGSGALGIEALSRGAAHATFCDLDPRALRAVADNLAALAVEEELFRIRRTDAWKLIGRWPEGLDDDALLLADPPWAEDLPARCLPAGLRAVESGKARAFALEHPADAPEPAGGPVAGIRIRRHRHGAGAFTLITRSPE